MTDIAGSHPPGAAENPLAAAERDAEGLREFERELRERHRMMSELTALVPGLL
jgi:hypothetical protein